jgi:hypothetical protein
MNDIKDMSWNDKFALIDRHNPSDEMICMVFGITLNELNKARELRKAGTFEASGEFDHQAVVDIFSSSIDFQLPTLNGEESLLGIQPMNPLTGQIFTLRHLYDADQPAESATKKLTITPPQKRGRKGDKIAIALSQVSTIPEPVEQFIVKHGVSLAVLRQAKRFISAMAPAEASAIGKVVVKQDKNSRVLMIWREDI